MKALAGLRAAMSADCATTIATADAAPKPPPSRSPPRSGHVRPTSLPAAWTAGRIHRYRHPR
jgi:hypothetical protein